MVTIWRDLDGPMHYTSRHYIFGTAKSFLKTKHAHQVTALVQARTTHIIISMLPEDMGREKCLTSHICFLWKRQESMEVLCRHY